MGTWVIKSGCFEARIDVNEIGQLPISQVRKLLRLSRVADSTDSLESFGPLLDKVRYKALVRLVEVIDRPLTELMDWDEIPIYYRTQKQQDALRRMLINNQKRVCDRLDKIKSIYVKEFMNYEH